MSCCCCCCFFFFLVVYINATAYRSLLLCINGVYFIGCCCYCCLFSRFAQVSITRILCVNIMILGYLWMRIAYLSFSLLRFFSALSLFFFDRFQLLCLPKNARRYDDMINYQLDSCVVCIVQNFSNMNTLTWFFFILSRSLAPYSPQFALFLLLDSFVLLTLMYCRRLTPVFRYDDKTLK